MTRFSSLKRARFVLAGLAAGVAAVAGVACGDDDAEPASPTASPTAATQPAKPSAPHYLIAFDAAAEAIHTVALPGGKVTGTITGLKFGAHNGALVHPDGRILFADDKNQEVVALTISATGHPEIKQKVKVDLDKGAIWGSLSADGKYFAVSGGSEDGGATQPLNIIDTTAFTAVSVQVPMAAKEELHPWIAGDLVVAAVGGEVRGWKLSEVLAGRLGAPATSVAVAAGSHGLVVNHDVQRLFLTTNDGLESISYAGGTLKKVTVIPWNVDGLSGGKNARPRLAGDATWVYGVAAAATPTEAERWAERQQDIHMANIKEGAAKRLKLGNGAFTRFQMAAKHAMFVNINPDGDAAFFVDTDPKSAKFQTVIGKVTLSKLANGPIAGEKTSGKESRSSALSHDSAWAFVSYGGEAKVDVIDVAKLSIAQTITLPTELKGGGYLLAYQPGQPSWDRVAR